MNLVILHYHLQRGGVTQVIQNHMAALASLPTSEQPSRILVITGERCEGWGASPAPTQQRVDLVTDPLFDYDPPRHATSDQDLTNGLLAVLKRHDCQATDTVLHLHNPTLGKKAAWPTTIAQLASQGWKWLLHIHDFAEDFRPENYEQLRLASPRVEPWAFQRWLYPCDSNIQYAALNARDARILRKSGIPESHVTLLPNPVSSFATALAETETTAVVKRLEQVGKRSLVLYPVRGIRRKNVPEFMLWSALFNADYQFAMTLPAETPSERRVYTHCQELAQTCELPIWWEVGCDPQIDFATWMAAADRLLTTSVTEGFGMVFLDAWLWGKRLMGRDLPEITADFKQAGLRLEGMSDAVWVPLNWLDYDELLEQLSSRYHEACVQFHLPRSLEQIRAEIEDWLDDEEVDFAHLPFSQQLKLVQRVAADRRCALELRARNPWMELSLRQPLDQERCEQNRRVIEAHYGQAAIGQLLQSTYRDLLGRQPLDEQRNTASSAEGPTVLDQFLSLDRFYPIRIE